MIPLARFVPSCRGWIGPALEGSPGHRQRLCRQGGVRFTTTRRLLEALQRDDHLRRICGWNVRAPGAARSTFSRAFEEFARMELPQFVHEALIRETQQDRLIGHIARDSTAIEAREHFPETAGAAKARDARREKPNSKSNASGAQSGREAAPRRPAAPAKGGRPRGPHRRYPGGKRPYMPTAETRLQTAAQHDACPRCWPICRSQCDSGGPRKTVRAIEEYWRGYKLHLDVADGQIPISAVLTSASVHDSQVAIPLATMTTQRVTYLYELMDAAYDADHIHQQSRSLGHVPIIDPKHRSPAGSPEDSLRANRRAAIELGAAGTV